MKKLKLFIAKIRAPKPKVISFIDFKNEILKLAKEFGKDYVGAKIEWKNHEGNIELWGYIDGGSWVIAHTVPEVIHMLREQWVKTPQKIEISDVLIPDDLPF